MILNIKPVPKPRMTRSDKWRKRDCVLNYYSFKDEILLQARDYELPDAFRVIFGVPFPRSYSLKKRAEIIGTPHQIKPDIDNYVKALMDAFKKEDSCVWHVDAKKIWTEGSGFIQIEPIDERY